MDAKDFIRKYPDYISEIELVVKSEYQPLVKELKDTDPHDLITPDTWFINSTYARGYVWSKFLIKAKSIKVVQ